MPFKIKLKKTRQYNVVSKSLFVISIELLDGVVVECTLGSESTGQECLENVCQKLVINQPEFFGLRYVSRTQQLRWVDLERPLKRQLDKHASSHQLYLRVMHYVISGTNLITDEMTRYIYFLQLKSDLLEGRIVCDCQQAVVLASYSRQAEYGNHDTERHTVEYLKNLVSFPKQMIEGSLVVGEQQLREGGYLEKLTAAVIQHHQALHNFSQAQAEEGYIRTCQLLNGYGQETFIARDHSRQHEVIIAISLTGIMVAIDNCETPKFYRWTDITNVINHKRTFSIECQNAPDSASFVFPTAEEGKYVWKMCVLQHTFYVKHQQAVNVSNNQATSLLQQSQPKFKNDSLGDSRDDLDCVPINKLNSGSMPGLLDILDAKLHLSHSGSQQGLQAIESSHDLSSTHRALSTSCLDLTNSNGHLRSQNDVDNLKSLLPSYRAAPDYDTAVKQKYNLQPVHFTNHQAHTHSHHSAGKPFIYGSQPEIHRPVHYPDVTRHTAINGPLRHNEDLAYGLNPIVHEASYSGLPTGLLPNGNNQKYLNVYKPPPPYPSNGLASNSTPDLAVASQISLATYHRGYINNHVSGSSPDLVSSRTFLSRQYMNHLHAGNTHNLLGCTPTMQNMMPPAHGTYENLASVMDMPSRHLLIQAPHHLGTHIQKLHDERGNVIYCMPTTQVPYRSHMVIPPSLKLKTVSDSQEPIYENVPLPWQSNDPSKSAIFRDRACSLTTPPDVNKVVERKVSHPVSIMLNTENNTPSSNVKVTTNLPAAINPNVQVNNVKYSPNSLYVNAQVIKSNENIKTINDSKISLQNLNHSSSNKDLQNITNSLLSMAISKESLSNISNAEVGSNASLRGSISSVNSNKPPVQIQQSDTNNITTITINSTEDIIKPPPGIAASSGTFTKSKSLSDNLHEDSLISITSTAQSRLDFTGPASSFFNSTNNSGYDMETSGISSTTSGSVTGKEKKKRRWAMFGGSKSSNKTDVKSATLGRDKNKKNSANSDAMQKNRWSTALPKVQPLPPSISKEAMCQLLERKMADSQLPFAFERIPKGRDINTDITVALYPENSHLNAGNLDYLPYDDNRVRLTPTKLNKYGYINASHITASVGSHQRFYVALSVGNGAASNGVWQTLWEAGARVVAYINHQSPPAHLPDLQIGRTKEFGQFQVFVESSQSSGYVVTTRLRVTNGKPVTSTGSIGQTRTIWHMQYTEWPENSLTPPSPEHFLGFLEELSGVRQHCAFEMAPVHNSNPPLVVSCSQGVGRTGVTIAADLLLYTLEHNQDLDMPRVISLLHQQRANLILSVHQYSFIHSLLIYYLKQTRLI